ncbi:MAG: hypothetical protein QOG87_274 [Actinomycetota bacterium]
MLVHRATRRSVVAFLTGLLLVGGAWAGVGLRPIDAPGGITNELPVASAEAKAATARLAGDQGVGLDPPDLRELQRLPAGQFLVGTGQTTLEPPADAPWVKGDACSQLADGRPNGEEVSDVIGAVESGKVKGGWPKTEDCIYLGGYGIGPARASTGVDSYAGVHVRSVAISNGEQTVLWQMIDMVGYFSKYADTLCSDCGMSDIRKTISRQTGIAVDNVAIAATHTHGGADGYGAWGGLPRWYRTFVRDQIIVSAYDALRDLQPASIEIGAIDARSFNNQRRDTYWSSADYGAVWLQAKELPQGPRQRRSPPVIATLVNFAAHPTVLGGSNTLMHGDWPGTVAKEMHDRLGGLGVIIEGGLGNVSPNRPRTPANDVTGDGTVDDYDSVVGMARDFTDFVGADIARGGAVLSTNDIVAKNVAIEHPVTNWAEAALGTAGLLDRQFLPGDAAGGPGVYQWDKGGPPGRGCQAAAPLTIKTDVTGYRIGELTVITAPGELFGTMAQVVKSRANRDATVYDTEGRAMPAGQTMVFGQTQDSLGYIIQHFEVDPAGGLTSNADLGEYEEEFMLDRCFGDHVLETQLQLADALK